MTTNDSTRIALVTGASRVLGQSMALHLCERGIDVVLTYRAGEREAQQVVAQIAAHGRKAIALPLDVARCSSFEAFYLRKELTRVCGREQLNWSTMLASVSTPPSPPPPRRSSTH